MSEAKRFHQVVLSDEAYAFVGMATAYMIGKTMSMPEYELIMLRLAAKLTLNDKIKEEIYAQINIDRIKPDETPR